MNLLSLTSQAAPLWTFYVTGIVAVIGTVISVISLVQKSKIKKRENQFKVEIENLKYMNTNTLFITQYRYNLELDIIIDISKHLEDVFQCYGTFKDYLRFNSSTIDDYTKQKVIEFNKAKRYILKKVNENHFLIDKNISRSIYHYLSIDLLTGLKLSISDVNNILVDYNKYYDEINECLRNYFNTLHVYK